MTNKVISTEGFIIILISGVAFLLTVQEAESLQAGEDSLGNDTITNTTELLYNMSKYAENLIDEGGYEHALRVLNETLSIYPNFTEAIKNKGNALYELGQYDEAIELYDRAISIDPNDIDAKIINELHYLI